MEDTTCAIFYNEPEQVIYKQILSSQEASNINDSLVSRSKGWKDGAQVIANGSRPFLEIDLDKEFPDIKERIKIVLRDYFPDVIVSPDSRFYNHQYGRVKPHTDGNRDGISQYTLLLYLCSEFEGGQLSIKMKRQEEERLSHNPHHYHKVFSFVPKLGYAVIFRKSLLHWADEVVDGNKNFLLLHLHSQF